MTVSHSPPEPFSFRRPPPSRAFTTLVALLVFELLAPLAPPALAARPPAPAHPLAEQITLEVDATDTAQWIYEVHQTIPAAPVLGEARRGGRMPALRLTDHA